MRIVSLHFLNDGVPSAGTYLLLKLLFNVPPRSWHRQSRKQACEKRAGSQLVHRVVEGSIISWTSLIVADTGWMALSGCAVPSGAIMCTPPQ
eukprot:gene8604-34045_t